MKCKCVYLVACVKKKEPSKMLPAEELYISDWFQKASRLVKATGCPWFILSAKHHLLAPVTIIGDYDKTLKKMSSRERKAWAEEVKLQMKSDLPNADAVVILAGKSYCEYLISYLEERFAKVMIPMKGLGIGEQLKWLKEADVKDILPC